MTNLKGLLILGAILAIPFEVLGHSQLIPNGDFSQGFNDWTLSDPEQIHIVALNEITSPGTPQGTSYALKIEAPWNKWVSASTEPFPVKPLERYRLSAKVLRIAGEWGFNLYVSWHDADKNVLGYEYIAMGALIGEAWSEYKIEGLAPEATRLAVIHIDLPPQWACYVTQLQLEEIDPGDPQLSIDILGHAASPKHAMREIAVRLENRGAYRLEDIILTITPPTGLDSLSGETFSYSSLTYNEATSFSICLKGELSELNSPLICRVDAKARKLHHTEGTPVHFEKSMPLFVSVAKEVPTPTSALTLDKIPDSKIALGAYYFPVMLDWDRNHWGVRCVNYLEPLLGYYDEARPEVADWHIYWALTHGIQFFVFDWYYNQGYSYLNDALEQGFLKSRFADKMRFCIDWCNEGHCSEFKAVDFDDESLRQFMTTLCERYFIHKNYLRMNGKPVVLIHVPVKIINAHGGWEGCRVALDKMRSIAQSYGHQGVYFVAVQNNTPFLLDYQLGGFDAVTAYAYGYRDVMKTGNTLPYHKLMPRHKESFTIAAQQAEARNLDYIPSAWVGWNDHARSQYTYEKTVGATPDAFRIMIDALPERSKNPQKLALFESWNEWGEGGEAEPGIQYRFGRLSAIRDILTSSRGEYEIAIPLPQEIEQWSTTDSWSDVHQRYLQRYAKEVGFDREFELNFNGVHDFWMNANFPVQFVDGTLRGKSINTDPGFLSPPLTLNADDISAIEVDLSVSSGTRMQLFWRSNLEETWSEDKSLSLLINSQKFNFNGPRQRYRFDLKSSNQWAGKIFQFRLDPSDEAGAEIILDTFRAVK